MQPSSLTFSGKKKEFKNSLKQHTYVNCFHLHSRYVVPISVDSHDPLNLILALYATRICSYGIL